MFDVNNFTYQTAKSLPVILLLDTSGSMNTDNRIGIMNRAVKEMLGSFQRNSSTIANIMVSIITFGGSHASIHLPMTSADELDLDSFQDMSAYGMTPLGSALTLAKEMMEDTSIIPSRSYRPTVILVSDGQPNDEWQHPLDAFQSSGRSSKCDRMAMGIDVDPYSTEFDVLKQFTGDEENIFHAADSAEISSFFQYVTMSTTSRTQTANPNILPSRAEISKQLHTAAESDNDFYGDIPF